MSAAGVRPPASGAGEGRPSPWDEAMAFGLGHLRLSPAEFWSMTPRELAAAGRALAPRSVCGPAPSRAALDALLALFPDAG